jgi:phosphoesterase RecJ-like protein
MERIESSKIEKLMSIIGDSRRISIVSHLKPDGDALGSCVAMFHFLGQCGKDDIRIVLPDSYPSYLDFITEGLQEKDILTYSHDSSEAEKAIASSDLIICLDFNAFHRTDSLENSLETSKAAKILIDHHLNPDTESFDLVFSKTEISSASELLYHILMATPVLNGTAASLDIKASTALMTGMTTDTNNFANSTYPSTLRMASSLLEAGVDRDAIISNLYNCHSENRLRLLGHMLKDLMTITEDGVAYIILDSATQKRYGISDGDTEGFVNMPLSIATIRMSLLLKEDGERIRVSIRSKKGTSANICSRLHFNGGGHENAAGGRLIVGKDVDSMADLAKYVEQHTHSFFEDEHEKNN